MNDAKIFREKAQLLSDAANATSNEQVRVTLLRLARSALQTAADIEAAQPRGRQPVHGDGY
jgi:hypothetical protein